MKAAVDLNNFIQTESLTKISSQLLKKNFVDVIVYLKSDELDNLGNVVYKSGFYKIIEVVTPPVPPDTKPTYTYEWKTIDIGGTISFAKTISTTNQPYLFEGSQFSSVDFEELDKFLKDVMWDGSCSSFIRDNCAWRSFDFHYNDTATFIVHNYPDRYFGIAGGQELLTREFVESGKESEYYDYLAGMIVDGMNYSGIFANVNMVHRETANPTKQTYDGRVSVGALALVSYILKNLHDINDLEDLMDKVNFWAPNVGNHDSEFHYLVSDGTITKCIEFIDNETVIIDISDTPIMTNFYLHNYDPDIPTTLNLHCQGVERYNIIKAGGDLKDIRWTKCYESIGTDKLLRSDFNDIYNVSGVKIDIKRTTPDDDPTLVAVLNAAKTAYETRVRDGLTWQSQHFAVYDFKTKSLRVGTQENYELWWKDWSKRFYKEYKVNKGWSLIDNSPEIYYDDKECTININMKFTPYDQNTMTCEPYEYTNIPLKKMPCPANLISVSTGVTALDICPISIKITNNKGTIELGDNVTDFHWELTYRYIETPKDYIRLNMPKLFGATASDTDDMGGLNPDFFALLKSNIKSITLDV